MIARRITRRQKLRHATAASREGVAAFLAKRKSNVWRHHK
jgi:hypothetical protein